MQNYCIGSVPETQKLYTTVDISELIGVTRTSVSGIAIKLGIKPFKEKGHNKSFFTYEQMKQIYLYEEAVLNRKQKIKGTGTKMLSLQELKKQHPLVKDERFFNLGYFPDVIPKNFED